ncbi:MAG: hypothetical protein CMJ81_12790 [Planctomycetaceae bacterium]|nr:hypothetical protein [Planctomycetaceae bacterium]MBP62806.1 hypothetical protein [Planctomycetaceae bacterium]
MRCHVYRPELFCQESIGTEATAFQQLQSTPLNTDVNYLAAPWSVLLNRERRRLKNAPRIQLDGGFTICQHIDFERIIPICRGLGLDTLFTPHVPRGFCLSGHDRCWMRHGVMKTLAQASGLESRLALQRVQGPFRVLPFPHLSIHGVQPAKKSIWYSFIGCNTHATRTVLFQLPVHRQALVRERQVWHFQASERLQKLFKREYQHVLARTRFSLCPRGTGPSTLRFWESLQAGAIPVLISDDMQLPAGVDWQRSIVRIAERDAAQVERILADIPLREEQELRRECIAAYRRFSGDYFVSCIRRFYCEPSGDELPVADFQSEGTLPRAQVSITHA